MDKILSIDPGVTTGLAWKLDSKLYITSTASSDVEVWSFIDPELVSQVVIERFQAQRISTYGLHTVRIIGGVMALCNRFHIPLEQHMPQARYGFLDDAKAYLKSNKGSKFVIHEVDALSHLLLFERNKERSERIKARREQ